MKQIEMQDLTIPPIAIGTWAWGKGPFGSKFIFGVSHGIEAHISLCSKKWANAF